jgi:hypothetical protein
MADKLRVGQDYIFGTDKSSQWTLFDVIEDTYHNLDGIKEMIYCFGAVSQAEGEECFAYTRIPGSVIRATKNGLVRSDNSYSAVYLRGREARDKIAKLEAARAHPREVELIRRAIQELKSLDDIQLLVPGTDIVKVRFSFDCEFKPGLVMGFKDQGLSLVHRTTGPRAYVDRIATGTYPIASLKFYKIAYFSDKKGLVLDEKTARGLETVEFNKLRTTDPVARFTELDNLLKGRGI